MVGRPEKHQCKSRPKETKKGVTQEGEDKHNKRKKDHKKTGSKTVQMEEREHEQEIE